MLRTNPHNQCDQHPPAFHSPQDTKKKATTAYIDTFGVIWFLKNKTKRNLTWRKSYVCKSFPFQPERRSWQAAHLCFTDSQRTEHSRWSRSPGTSITRGEPTAVVWLVKTALRESPLPQHTARDVLGQRLTKNIYCSHSNKQSKRLKYLQFEDVKQHWASMEN